MTAVIEIGAVVVAVVLLATWWQRARRGPTTRQRPDWVDSLEDVATRQRWRRRRRRA